MLSYVCVALVKIRTDIDLDFAHQVCASMFGIEAGTDLPQACVQATMHMVPIKKRMSLFPIFCHPA